MEAIQQQDYIYTYDLVSPPQHTNNKTYHSNSDEYQIYNYNRNMIADDNSTIRLYKSVICSIENGNPQIKSIGPPKSIPYNLFTSKYNLDDSIITSQLMEGTMINLFYNNGKWNIHTRGAVGGNYFYFRNQYYADQFSDNRQISFYDMFMECLQASENEGLNDLSIMDSFSKSHVYSFVMQHPDNHIVIPVARPQLYLTHVFKITESNQVENITDFMNNSELKGLHVLNGLIQIPTRFQNMGNFNDMIKQYCDIQEDYTNVGLAFYNTKTGERTVYKSESYVTMKSLRGNNPNLQYQYLALRRTDKVKEFLQYFPNYKKLFYKFYSQYRDFMKHIHTSYYQYYIKKTISHVNNKYMPHIYRIHHNVYIPSVNANSPKIITIGEVYNYFDNIDIGELLYALNYDNRQVENDRTTN